MTASNSALPRSTWVVVQSKFPSKSRIVRVMEHATCDEAMSVVRLVMAEHTDWSVSASNTEPVRISVANPDDSYAEPIYEGSVSDMGKWLIAGTYFATDMDSNRSWVYEYEIEEDGSVWHRMR